MWTESESVEPLRSPSEREVSAHAEPEQPGLPQHKTASLAKAAVSEHGWCLPSTLSLDPEEARASIALPRFENTVIQKAQAISEYFSFADSECRGVRETESNADESETPRFERVFRMAATIANVACEADKFDELLVLTAWYCVRPQEEGFLGSYPKSLLCPLSHAATPEALNALPPARRIIFERRVPVYLRYLLCEKFGLRNCAELEDADLRQLLRNTGFRLIRASAVPEIAFPGITRGDDPPVRPWKIILRQELTDERAADMLVRAAVWHIRHSLKLVSIQAGHAQWNIGAFARMDWEDAFLSVGVRVAPSLTRESGLIDWRAVLERCLDQIGPGNLPPDLLAKVRAVPQRISHDSNQSIWSVLDRVSETVLARARLADPSLSHEGGRLNYKAARTFRRWARLFDEVSPNILSRFGISAFTALHRVAPESFGLGRDQLKPWEVEQEHGKWKGSRGRALLRSAYAFALYEAGLGDMEYCGEEVTWKCSRAQFLHWSEARTGNGISPYDFLYRLASSHGLTPLLSREITHTAAISLLAGMNLHENLPRIEGCWEVCMRTALERHGGKLEVRLSLPDLVPLPLRLRKAVLAPLRYNYLHKELRLVRDFDRRMARESHRKLEEIPGWWDDDRIIGTPLAQRVNDTSEPVRTVLKALNPEPWLEPHQVRFRALRLLISRDACTGQNGEPLTSKEIAALLSLAREALAHTNIVQVSLPAIERGFDRLLAREDTRELLDSLLTHIGTAFETEVWGQVRRFIVLDVVNDMVALTVRNSLLHLMSTE